MAGPDVDVAILGGGCAGLALAMRLADRGVRQCIIEPREQYCDDRSWSFWASGQHGFEDCRKGTWSRWSVSAGAQSVTRQSRQLSYQTLSAGRFYDRALAICNDAPDTRLALGARVTGGPIRRGGHWHVETDRGALTARAVVDTRPRGKPGGFGQYFIGRELRTEAPVFDAQRVELMSFATPRDDRIDFTYVLPFAPDHALIEATTFGFSAPPRAEMTEWLDREIASRVGGARCHTVRDEAGFIPMQPMGGAARSLGPSHAFAGIAGGAARPSTGYAFQRILAQTAFIAGRLAANTPDTTPDITPPRDGTVTRFMDGLFLRVLQRAPQRGGPLFLSLFQNAPEDRLERFLSGSTAPLDRASVIAAMPPRPFLRELIRT